MSLLFVRYLQNYDLFIRSLYLSVFFTTWRLHVEDELVYDLDKLVSFFCTCEIHVPKVRSSRVKARPYWLCDEHGLTLKKLFHYYQARAVRRGLLRGTIFPFG